MSNLDNPKVKTSDDKSIIILDDKGEPDVFVYFNPFTKLWTSISKYGGPVINPDDDLEKFLSDILKFRNDMKEFWSN